MNIPPLFSKKSIHLENLPDWLRAKLSDSQRHFFYWIIAGSMCGFVAVLFHLVIDKIFELITHLSTAVGGFNSYMILLFAPAIGGLISGLIIYKFAPHAVGSGIPQTKIRYYRDFGFFKLREAVWRFIVGSISVGSGMSLGREGPTVHICAAIASKVGQVFGVAKKRVQAMVPVGMGAGIAAAFNTPMAAMFFVYEELLHDFSSKSLFGILVAVVIASIIERSLLGEHPVFMLDLPEFYTDWWMLLSIPVGIMAALIGGLFVKSLLFSRQKFKDWEKCPIWLRPAIGGLAVGITGVSVLLLTDRMGVFGIGYNDLSSALNGRTLLLSVLVPLFIGKFIATIIAYSSGGSGGLFAPSLFIGAIMGAIIGVLGQMAFGYDSTIVGAVSLLGMGAFFAAVIRCPMTSFMIIFEMTHNYTLMLPLMLGNIIAFVIASKKQSIALYDSLLLQDNISLKKMSAYKGEQDWQSLPIKTIMTFDILSLKGDLTCAENLENLNGLKHHGYPVLDSEKHLLGMFTHHELIENVRDKPDTKLSELICTQSLVFIEPEQSIRAVARTLVIKDVMQAPVVSPTDQTRLVGIVTLHDIARQQNAIEDAIGRD